MYVAQTYLIFGVETPMGLQRENKKIWRKQTL